MKNRSRPRKSLRTWLMLWFLVFSIVPLAFITGYSLKRYESAIDQELSMRLTGNAREIEVIFEDFAKGVQKEVKSRAADRALIHYLSTNNLAPARELTRQWLNQSFLSRVWVYSREGRLEIALYRNELGEVVREQSFESNNVYLNEGFLKSAQERDSWSALDIFSTKTELRPRETGARMELAVYSKVKNASGQVVGFIEAVLLVDQNFLDNLRNRMNLEILVSLPGKQQVFATNKSLRDYSSDFFAMRSAENKGQFDLKIAGSPFRFMVKRSAWADSEMFLGIGASKAAAQRVLENINAAFTIVVGGIIALLVVLSLVFSKILLSPIYTVLDALRSTNFEEGASKLPVDNDTELGLLAESFNEMSSRIFEAQRALKEKIKELEAANIEIRDTQARLVHTAKMASLGQLVAGVAHELNNPIGFIYSNMAHLKAYSEKLIQLLELAEANPAALKAAKDEADFAFLVKDMPKLIASCEDGARRTRDIVLGLRNFSRLDEAQLKEVDIHEGLEATLSLLAGELKNRIKIERHFGALPKVTCYPSQMNQVFMNILSNATHAIEGEGTITISTRKLNEEMVEIAIRDTGKGMSKATLDKIFDPFFTTKGTGKGTGLGLSISYGVVQKHGGEILVDSELGKGTEFRIRIPKRCQA